MTNGREKKKVQKRSGKIARFFVAWKVRVKVKIKDDEREGGKKILSTLAAAAVTSQER